MPTIRQLLVEYALACRRPFWAINPQLLFEDDQVFEPWKGQSSSSVQSAKSVVLSSSHSP